MAGKSLINEFTNKNKLLFNKINWQTKAFKLVVSIASMLNCYAVIKFSQTSIALGLSSALKLIMLKIEFNNY